MNRAQSVDAPRSALCGSEILKVNSQRGPKLSKIMDNIKGYPTFGKYEQATTFSQVGRNMTFGTFCKAD